MCQYYSGDTLELSTKDRTPITRAKELINWPMSFIE